MLKIDQVAVIEDTPTEGVKKVRVEPDILYPAAIARIRELISLVRAHFGNVQGWTALGVMGQMGFALQNNISRAELPLITSFFEVPDPDKALDDALLPVWELKQANLQPTFAQTRDKDEKRLFARRWMLDAALALFMREMKDYAVIHKFNYNTTIGRDLRYKHAWVSAEEANA